MAPLLVLLALAAPISSPPARTSAPVAVVGAEAVRPGEQPVDPYVQADSNAGATPIRDAATLKAFHGAAGLQRISDDFVERDLKDARIKDVFAAADVPRLKRTFAEQLCYLLDGGCSYSGRDMATAHKGMGLQNADFNAVVENLQKAMNAEHVPFRAQNVLLAKLAPMQRVVVERTSPALLKEAARRVASLRPAN